MIAKPLYTATPVYKSYATSKQTNAEVFYKMECYQPSGSFKIRGMDVLVNDLVGGDSANTDHYISYAFDHKISRVKSMVFALN
jgi:threonine dehydratase